MPPDRRNLRGRLKKLEREREKMAAQARANRRGFAFSGPYTMTGRGTFSADDLARLRERGHYVHVIGVVRMAGETSRSYGAQDTDDASDVSGDCEMLDVTTTLADLRAYNAALDEVELVRAAIYERLMLGSGLAEALQEAAARVVTSHAWTSEVEVGPETEVALLVGALSEAQYEAVEDAYPVDGVPGNEVPGCDVPRDEVPAEETPGTTLSAEARRPDRLVAGLERVLRLLRATPHALFACDVHDLLCAIEWLRGGAGAGGTDAGGTGAHGSDGGGEPLGDPLVDKPRIATPAARRDVEAVIDAFVQALAPGGAAEGDGAALEAEVQEVAFELVGVLAQGYVAGPATAVVPAADVAAAVVAAAHDADVLRVLDAVSARVTFVDGDLLDNRDALLRLLLTVVRADRGRFRGLYDALRAEPLLPTHFPEVLSDFPDLLPKDERLLVSWQEPKARNESF